MIERFAYARGSRVDDHAVRFSPNLAREPVAFNAELLSPLRFREAISAMHDVVVSDLRFVKRDKSDYEAWKADQAKREALFRREAHRQAEAEIAAKRGIELPKDLKRDFERARRDYWSVRQKYSDYLRKHEPLLWRKLMPCDPVITVAEDVVFFECFSKDESAYGCLSVDRERGFGQSSNFQLGTTNVDYSQDLYEQFQTLRTYRTTRFDLDPEGFGVSTQSLPDYREEKIDLPSSWLRGFMKLQAAMTMPKTRIVLTREVVYSLLAFLKRNIAQRSPRALRFELEPGQPVRLVLEPWEKVFEVFGPPYEGYPTAPIRIWGTRRLLVLARLLPLIESIDVDLLANGLPSFWIARLGDMNFTLGLSGWTTNDWSQGSALDLLQPPRTPSPELISRVAAAMKSRRRATIPELQIDTGEADSYLISASLRSLAQSGQVIYDIAHNRFRYRQVMSQALGEAQLGPGSPELIAAKSLIGSETIDLTQWRNRTKTGELQIGKVKLIDWQDAPNQTRLIVGNVEAKPVEILLDRDDRIKRGKCLCGHFKQFGLRNGPCRHMIALRFVVTAEGRKSYEESYSQHAGNA